jgi:hypothetical protein
MYQEQVNYGNHVCDHCGVMVPVAKICPCCRNHHSKEWLARSEKNETAISWIFLLAMLYFFIRVLDYSNNLPFDFLPKWAFNKDMALPILNSFRALFGIFVAGIESVTLALVLSICFGYKNRKIG